MWQQTAKVWVDNAALACLLHEKSTKMMPLLLESYPNRTQVRFWAWEPRQRRVQWALYTHTLGTEQTDKWGWDGAPEAKHWDVLSNGWDGGSEGQGANLQVRQTSWPLLGAAARVCADTWWHVTVKGVGVPRLGDIVAWGHLPKKKLQMVFKRQAEIEAKLAVSKEFHSLTPGGALRLVLSVVGQWFFQGGNKRVEEFTISQQWWQHNNMRHLHSRHLAQILSFHVKKHLTHTDWIMCNILKQ